jgi:hypothetical protein
MACVGNQSDFTTLTFTSAEDDNDVIGNSVHHLSLSRSGSLSKIVDEAVPDYIPKNCIQPEVLALISAWEATMNNTMHGDIIDASYNESHTIEDPMPPPTRFYLTRWRSIVKRVLERDA